MILRRIISQPFSRLNYFVRTKSSSNSPESTNQLIKTLNNQGHYDRAFQLFDILLKQHNVNDKSLLLILDTCARSRQIEHAHRIETLINQSKKWRDNIRLQTSLIHLYMKCQMVDQAERIFQRICQLPQCDIIVYNAMLKGYLQNHQAERCFDQMPSKFSPDYLTYILLLNACSVLRNVERGIAIHAESSHIEHVHLQNALISSCGRINRIESAEKVFLKEKEKERTSFCESHVITIEKTSVRYETDVISCHGFDTNYWTI